MSDVTYLILYVSGCIAIGFSAGLLFLWMVRVPLSNWIEKLKYKYPNVFPEKIKQLKK